MPRPEDDDRLLEMPTPAEQARVRGAIKSNLDLLSPIMRQKYQQDSRDQAELSAQYGLSPDRAFQRRTTVEMGAEGIVRSGGPRKGEFTSIESGAGGIIAAGGQKRGGYVSVAASANGIIARNAAYQRGKKFGAGALAGARYGTLEMFPGKFPNIIGGPISVGNGASAGCVNLDLFSAARKGFANRSNP